MKAPQQLRCREGGGQLSYQAGCKNVSSGIHNLCCPHPLETQAILLCFLCFSHSFLSISFVVFLDILFLPYVLSPWTGLFGDLIVPKRKEKAKYISGCIILPGEFEKAGASLSGLKLIGRKGERTGWLWCERGQAWNQSFSSLISRGRNYWL